MPRFTLFFIVRSLDIADYDGVVVAGNRIGASRGFDLAFAGFLKQELGHAFEERWVEQGFPVIEIRDIKAPTEEAATEKAYPNAEHVVDALALLEPESPTIEISHSTRPR